MCRCDIASCVGRHSIVVLVATFRVSRRRRKMYIGHVHLCVCLCAAAFLHYYTDPDVTWGVVVDALYYYYYYYYYICLAAFFSG